MTHEVHIPVPGLTHPIKPAGVVIIDGETGEAIPASALFGVTLAELLASVLPVAPNVTRGGGALDANTQRVTLATDGPGVASLSSIDNKTPALVSGAGPVIATPRICLGSFCFSATTTSRSLTDLDATEYTTTTPCVPAFAAQALAMASNPAMLHYAVTADYATRWPDLIPPTLTECEAFCAGASLSSPITDTTAT